MATKKDTLGAVLCKALGLDVARVIKLTLTCEVDCYDVAEVTYAVLDAETAEVATEVRRYVLTDVT